MFRRLAFVRIAPGARLALGIRTKPGDFARLARKGLPGLAFKTFLLREYQFE
jgi:hypothetical protein